MLRNKTRQMILAGTLSVGMGVSAAPVHAGFFDWLFHRNQPQVVAVANPCDPCAQQTTVAYAARTSYRLGFVNVPVTTMRPVTACDPCSGTATTAMQPTTTYVRRLRFVPQTTYRPVVVNRPVATAAYMPTVAAAPVVSSGCATGNCGSAAPATYYTPGAATPTPSLSGYAPTTTYAAPATTYAAPATTYSQPSTSGYAPTTTYAAPSTTYSQPSTTYSQPSTTYAPQPSATYSQPTPAQQPATSAEPRTFMREPLNNGTQQPSEQPQPQQQQQQQQPSNGTQLQPIPESSIKNSGGGLFQAPRLLDPKDKAAQREEGFRVMPAVHVQPAQRSQEALDADGWRAAR